MGYQRRVHGDSLFCGRGENTSTMMKLVLLSVACLVGVQCFSKLAKKIHRDITKFNNDAACWGKGNAIKFRVALINAAEQCSSSPSHHQPGSKSSTTRIQHPKLEQLVEHCLPAFQQGEERHRHLRSSGD